MEWRGTDGRIEEGSEATFECEGERNNEFMGLSLIPEESFVIVGKVTHFVECHHQQLCTNIAHFGPLYLLLFVFCQKYSSH